MEEKQELNASIFSKYVTMLCLTEITPVCVTVAVDASFSQAGVLTGSQFPVIRQIWTEKHRAELSGFPDWIISQYC